MSYKIKSLVYFMSLVIASLIYYNVANNPIESIEGSTELAKADIETTTQQIPEYSDIR